ncbi:MAG: hypothetical protein ACE5F1_12180 [Planctomycetota bacterium]
MVTSRPIPIRFPDSASARQVLIRLTLVSGHQGAGRAWMTVQSLADARDL